MSFAPPNLRALAIFLALTVAAAAARAAEPAPEESGVDVTLHDAAPPHRAFTVEWNPLPLIALGRVSLNLTLTPGEHHAITLSQFFAWASTFPSSTSTARVR